jgi:hypothetical protein
MLRTLGPEHQYSVQAEDELAQCYRALRQRARALPLAETALAEYRRQLGDEAPATRQLQGVVEDLRKGPR